MHLFAQPIPSGAPSGPMEPKGVQTGIPLAVPPSVPFGPFRFVPGLVPAPTLNLLSVPRHMPELDPLMRRLISPQPEEDCQPIVLSDSKTVSCRPRLRSRSTPLI